MHEDSTPIRMYWTWFVQVLYWTMERTEQECTELELFRICQGIDVGFRFSRKPWDGLKSIVNKFLKWWWSYSRRAFLLCGATLSTNDMATELWIGESQNCSWYRYEHFQQCPQMLPFCQYSHVCLLQQIDLTCLSDFIIQPHLIGCHATSCTSTTWDCPYEKFKLPSLVSSWLNHIGFIILRYFMFYVIPYKVMYPMWLI